MKNSSSSFLPGGVLALLCILSAVAWAQPTVANPDQASPPPPPPAADPAPAASVAPATPASAEPEKPAEDKPLRRIDEPPERPERRRGGRRAPDGPPFGDHAITEGNRVREAISIMGSTTVEGEVAGDAVSVLGNTAVHATGKVGGAAVAVLGRLDVKGEVRQEAVSVLGSAAIDGRVGREVVAVLGDLELGPNAVIGGDVVTVGGKLKKDPKAVVKGNEVHVPFLFGKVNFEWLGSYVGSCVMLGRPLAFAPHLGWAWMIALSFFALYLLIALLFSGPLTKCVQTLETRPGPSVLAAVLTVLLTPVAIVLLCFTVIGIVLVPFVLIALVFAGLFGKATMLAWIGRRFTKFFGEGVFSHIFFAVLLGGVLVLLLYTVPVLGFLLLKLLGWLGLGVVVYTILVAMKRPKPAVAAAGVAMPGVASAVAPTTSAPAPGSLASMSANLGAASAGVASEPPAAVSADVIPPALGAVPVAPPPVGTVPPASAQPVVVASTLPRAGFMIRLGALLIDVVLLAIVAAFFGSLIPRGLRVVHIEPPGMLPLLAIYGAILWKLKGTTIGGIVCGLKVVRIDNRPIDWATAIVRALGCFLSLVIVGLGFIWVAIDDEKQSWHDKIAGTTVVRVPKGVSLL